MDAVYVFPPGDFFRMFAVLAFQQWIYPKIQNVCHKSEDGRRAVPYGNVPHYKLHKLYHAAQSN
jgi:hypothetical protein